MESLAQRAALLRESLGKSQAATAAVVSNLGSFDNRLSALEAAMRPIQVWTHAVRTAHENIDHTLRSIVKVLRHLAARSLGSFGRGGRSAASCSMGPLDGRCSPGQPQNTRATTSSTSGDV